LAKEKEKEDDDEDVAKMMLIGLGELKERTVQR